MISTSLDERLRDLRARGESFVTATVVRALHSTSAQAGNVALVRSDGSIEGFVGGVCAQHSVRLYSLQVMENGAPMLLRIIPGDSEGEADDLQPVPNGGDAGEEITREEGAVTIRNPCLSGGAIELFLDLCLPPPRVLVVGESPIVEALNDLGPRLGLRMVAARAGAADAPAPAAGDLAVVVAAHGQGEVVPLRAAVEAGVPYVGLVASPKRGAAVIEELRKAGVDAEAASRVETPAGIEIGARTSTEIALSILARIVEVRRTGDAQADAPRAGVAAAGGGGPRTAVDPICGMTVVVLEDTPSLERDGDTTYFCCQGCKDSYERQLAA